MSSKTHEGVPGPVAEDRIRPWPEAVSDLGTGAALYMFRVRKSWLGFPIGNHRTLLFLTEGTRDRAAGSDGDRIRRVIRRLVRSRKGLIRWFGRVSFSVYRNYHRLEDRIDPMERMVKGLERPKALEVWCAAPRDGESQFRDCLRVQVIKHSTWLIVDAGVAAVSILLMPIPGPNILGWYPFLRLLSHYSALKAARRALAELPARFRYLPALADLEERLHRERDWTEAEVVRKVDGLDRFLKRVR